MSCYVARCADQAVWDGYASSPYHVADVIRVLVAQMEPVSKAGRPDVEDTAQLTAESSHLPQHGTAQHDTAQHGTVQRATAHHGTAQPGVVHHATAQRSTTAADGGQQPGAAQHATAQYVTAQHNAAQTGAAQHAMAQRSTAASDGGERPSRNCSAERAQQPHSCGGSTPGQAPRQRGDLGRLRLLCHPANIFSDNWKICLAALPLAAAKDGPFSQLSQLEINGTSLDRNGNLRL